MIYFVTFGSYNYTKQVERIKQEAAASGFFDVICPFYPRDLSPDFRQKHGAFLHGRGYGFWIWKPQCILQTLDSMKQGDILVYADSGCTINPHGKARFAEYIQMVQDHPSGIVTFQMPEHSDVQFTKREVFDRLGFDHIETPQICATYLIIRKCPSALTLVSRWSELTQDYSLIDDTKVRQQSARFKDHRHDQSVWSILNKNNKSCIISTDEGWPPGRLEYPIWGSRIRGSDDSNYTHLIK